MDSDAGALGRLGCAQELPRRVGGFSSFAVSFSIISVLTGCITAYADAIGPGRPAALGLGWPLVSVRQRRLGVDDRGHELGGSGGDRRRQRLRLRERARRDARPRRAAVVWSADVLVVCSLPPNQLPARMLASAVAILARRYFTVVRKRFEGPRVKLAALEGQ